MSTPAPGEEPESARLFREGRIAYEKGRDVLAAPKLLLAFQHLKLEYDKKITNATIELHHLTLATENKIPRAALSKKISEILKLLE